MPFCGQRSLWDTGCFRAMLEVTMTTCCRRSLSVFLILPVALSAALWTPPSGIVRGHVVDARGPVGGVTLQLRDAEAQTAALRVPPTLSEDNGTFVIRDVPPGRWLLEARRVGYTPSTQNLTVRSGETTTVQIVLRAVAQPLDTVSVVQRNVVPERYGASSRMHEFYRRRARARGRFFTRDEIEASGRAKLTDLLRLVPGARVTTFLGNRAEVAFARCTGPVQLAQSGSLMAVATHATRSRGGTVALYVNGARVDTISAKETLGEFDLGEIEAIEVYRGISELPPEALADACAAIFIWTRFGPGEPVGSPESARQPRP